MRQHDSNIVTMASNTAKVIGDYKKVWTKSKAFSELETLLNNLLYEGVKEQTSAQKKSTGVTKDKQNAKEKAVDYALELAGIGISYAIKIHNFTLKDQLTITRSQFLNLREKLIVSKLDDIYETIEKVLPELGYYNVTEKDLDILEKHRNIYNTLVDAPRQTILKRKGHNANATASVAEILVVLEQMDPLVPPLKNAGFTQDYKNARIVIEYGSGGTKSEDDKNKPE